MSTKRADKIVYDYQTMQLVQIRAKRFYKADGATFSGWVVSNDIDPHHCSDPISNRTDAIATMYSMYDGTYKDYLAAIA